MLLSARYAIIGKGNTFPHLQTPQLIPGEVISAVIFQFRLFLDLHLLSEYYTIVCA